MTSLKVDPDSPYGFIPRVSDDRSARAGCWRAGAMMLSRARAAQGPTSPRAAVDDDTEFDALPSLPDDDDGDNDDDVPLSRELDSLPSLPEPAALDDEPVPGYAQFPTGKGVESPRAHTCVHPPACSPARSLAPSPPLSSRARARSHLKSNFLFRRTRARRLRRPHRPSVLRSGARPCAAHSAAASSAAPQLVETRDGYSQFPTGAAAARLHTLSELEARAESGAADGVDGATPAPIT